MTELYEATAIALEPLKRLTKDLLKAADTLSKDEARFLVDAYYILQRNRITSANQVRTLEENEEPHTVIEWLGAQNQMLENQLKRALDKWSSHDPVGVWAKCAPPWAEVLTQNRRAVAIADLHTGDMVLSFNRKKASLTRPRPIAVSVKQFEGDLIHVQTYAATTSTTPIHKWLVRLARKDIGYSVYLMRAGDRFRVGRTLMFHERGKDYLRWRMQTRARQEQAEVWLLKLCSTEREAAIYEEFIATHYGLTEWPFRSVSGRTNMTTESIDELFAMLQASNQQARAGQCLVDHGRMLGAPLWQWTGSLSIQSGTQCLKTAAANLIPEMMEIPAPTVRYGVMDWQPIKAVERIPYAGPVYSLDVEEHHTYVQDGLVTCNSICGIGPVISAGLLAHIDITRAPTAGHIWAFAGLDPSRKWNKGEKRPYNAALKTLTAFKLGESFVKVQNKDEDIYGRVFAHRKQQEIERNDEGAFKDIAAERLSTVNKSTEAYKAYKSGKLPPAHIHARARRYAVKLFLAHYHMVAYFQHYRTMPPFPYVFSHLEGHVDFVAPPHADLIPGLPAAVKKYEQELRQRSK